MLHDHLSREAPWHLRIPNSEHNQWYKNLVELHRMTVQWRLKTHTENLIPQIHARLGRKVQESLWMLDSISDFNNPSNTFEHLLDDTAPEDVLGRLEQAVWAVQAVSLRMIINQANSSEILEILKESARLLGRACVEARWKNITGKWKKKNQDIRDVLLALHDSPLSGYPHKNGFLVKRATSQEIQIELLSCPHNVPYPEVQNLADTLCRLHAEWISGFNSGLNDQIQVEYILNLPRCLQYWRIA
jgi:hypothetical protein